MGRVAYTISEAAEAAAVGEHVIANAIRGHELIARAVGKNPIVLQTDLQAWLESLPVWGQSGTIRSAVHSSAA